MAPMSGEWDSVKEATTMGDTIRLTAMEGNQLLSDCFSVVVPSKIEGVGTWDPNTRATITQNIRQLKKALAKVSDIFKAERKTMFGPLEWYEKQERTVSGDQKERELDQTGEPVRYRYVLRPEAKDKDVEVTMTGQAKKGLYILLLLRLHPGPCSVPGNQGEFSQALTAGFQDERIWPIAEKLGVVKDLEAKIGAGKGSDVSFSTDEEIEAEAAGVKGNLIEGSFSK